MNLVTESLNFGHQHTGLSKKTTKVLQNVKEEYES
jgi:hypothetical protein